MSSKKVAGVVVLVAAVLACAVSLTKRGRGSGDERRASRAAQARRAPVLFFTDITSGPSRGGRDDLGAFVSIYGDGFGERRGRSTVTIGGTRVARYVVWGEDNAVARGQDLIVIQPGPRAVSGEIVVTVDGRASNPLPFTIRSGRIHFVAPDAPNARDSNPGTWELPARTLHGRSRDLQPGDIVYVKGGRFEEADPRCPGWDAVLCIFPEDHPSGTPGAPVAYVGYPGDPPVLGGPGPMRRAIILGDTMAHYVIAGMEFTHRGGLLEVHGEGHRIVGNYFHDGIHSNGGVIGVGGDTAHHALFGNHLRDNGEAGDKMNGSGLYVQGFGVNLDIDFGWNQIEDQRGARAIQAYGHRDGDRIEDLRIHDNLISGSELNNIVLGGSDGATPVLGTVHVFNNVIVGSGDSGLRINDPEGAVIVENNVLYDNGSPGLSGARAQLHVERAGTGRVTLRNNILYAGSDQSYFLIGTEAGPSAISASHDLVFGAGGCPEWDVACVNADPLFADADALDFRLRAGSPAIDAGVATEIHHDYVGNARPRGAAYDIGAIER
ncbi:MAG: hypothetical protein HYY06_19780 [Deltaproteobacteria bacterium]|nr:hypothetical protein [Deltaproteobacteria bacterium]